jgi:hypothetical protein
VATKPKLVPKRIVYLWGAGATQGEAQNLGSKISLLMGDSAQFGEGITTRILRRAGKRVSAAYGATQALDIEKLISLLAVSGVSEHAVLADELRTHYFDELRTSLTNALVIDNPELAIGLLAMHNDRKFDREVESLSGILTTNHDGLLQIASQAVFGEVNLAVSFVSEDVVLAMESSTPPIVQLHGSFTWEFGVPMRVSMLRATSKYSRNTVWIPPTTLKESKQYPFNRLTGLAYELLAEHCDVLRVVGASLTQNDWNVLSLIFNAQRHREYTKGNPFRIELIMPQEIGDRIARECGYLRHLTPIGFLSEGRFADFKDKQLDTDSDLVKPFGYCLQQKWEFHASRGEFDEVEARGLVAQAAGEAHDKEKS